MAMKLIINSIRKKCIRSKVGFYAKYCFKTAKEFCLALWLYNLANFGRLQNSSKHGNMVFMYFTTSKTKSDNSRQTLKNIAAMMVLI